MLALISFKLFLLNLSWSASAEIKLSEVVPFVQVDAYAPCLRALGDSYCFVTAKLYADNTHPLYNALVQHSSNKLRHFDRTNVYRGICLKTCQKYSSSSNETVTLEYCLNATLSRDYGLSAKVSRILCSQYRERVQFDTSDFAFGAVLVVLLVLNLFGSLYDFYGGDGKDIVSKLLLCFAVRRNWSRLIAPASTEPEQRRLRGLSAYKVLYTLWVIFAHTGIPFLITLKNSDYPEQALNDVFAQIVLNGTQKVQIFFIMSALLLTYNLLIAEKHQRFAWQNLHKAIFARWLRLTPVYALVILFLTSWMRHVGEGPFWKTIVDGEAMDCRRDWWLHLLYIQNYVDIDSRCMLHSWYLPTEMQLTIVGLAIFFLLKSTKARQTAIGVVVTVGVIAPAATTFYHNIDPVVITTPEKALNGYVQDPTFNKLYKRGHNNLICYGIGLALGYIVFYLKDSDIGAQKYKKYRLLNCLLYPATLALALTGVGLHDGVPPLKMRAIYSSAVKFVFGLLTALHIFFTILQVDNLRARVYNWYVWTVLGRLTYSVYLIHMSILSMFAATRTTTIYASLNGLCKASTLVASTSFLLAVPLFLMVEAPFAQVARICLGLGRRSKRDD